jgi:hypothetical protein
MKQLLTLVAVASAVPGAAQAVALAPLSYSAPGAGNGSFSYQDDSYDSTTGQGDLTDGVIPPAHWNSYSGSNLPWVGWSNINPAITFTFAPGTVLDTVAFYFDNSTDGGVALPAGVSFALDGVTLIPTSTTVSYPGATGLYSYDLGGATGETLVATITRNSQWTMLGEVTFTGTPGGSVPEPASWATMLAGFGLLGAGLRRRRQRRATALA